MPQNHLGKKEPVDLLSVYGSLVNQEPNFILLIANFIKISITG